MSTDEPKDTPLTLYLDMSVIKEIARGAASPRIPKARFVYSSEHLSEIRRGNALFLLHALDSLRAYELSVDLNDQFQISDNATLRLHDDIEARYADHVKSMSPANPNLATLHTMAATMWGANSSTKALRSIEDMPKHILPADQMDRNPGILAEANRVSTALLETLRPTIHQRPSLRKMRRQFGSDKAETGKLDAKDVIPEIWRHVSARIADLTIEQAFGKVPLADYGYATWPVYLSIIQCHAMLNTFGYLHDEGMADETKTANILSDAAHIAHAAFCDVLVTEDRRMADKASAIYAFLELRTAVWRIKKTDYAASSPEPAG